MTSYKPETMLHALPFHAILTFLHALLHCAMQTFLPHSQTLLSAWQTCPLNPFFTVWLVGNLTFQCMTLSTAATQNPLLCLPGENVYSTLPHPFNALTNWTPVLSMKESGHNGT
jgi:hypothetical protein